MILKEPFFISARLMPAVKIDDLTISIEYRKSDRDGRTQYRVFFDFADGRSFEENDLRSGCQGGDLQEGMESLLSFLGAAGESYRYALRRGFEGIDQDSNASLFQKEIVEWAADHDDEISMLQCELEETKDSIQE